jgi:basic membrane protein A
VRNTRALAVTLAAVALLFMACGQAATSPSPAPASEAASQPASQAASQAPSAAASPSAPASEAPSAKPLKIGVVTDVGQLEDKSFNQFSNQGALDAAEELGGEHRVIVTEEIADYQQNIQTFVDEGFDVIVTIGFLIGTDTLNAAKANPDIVFMGVDQGICVDAEGNADPTFTCAGDAAALIPNYQGIVFKEAQPGYLVGIVAATISESAVIGAVGGTNVPAVVAFRDGYFNGARSVNPDIEVLYVESNPDPVIGFNDPERGAEIAGQMIDEGADVLFQVAGGTGVGVLETACAADIHGIGVDVDQALSLPPQAAECVVTSAEKKLQDTVKTVILSVATDSFKPGTVVYDLNSEPPGVGISPFHDFESLLTPDLQAALDEATAGMKDGSIDPAVPSGL